MGLRTTYEPGTFSWVELETPAADRAHAFYTGVFDWEAAEDDIDGVVSTVFRVDGSAVAGLRWVSGDVAPSWQSFVTVADVDAVAARARDLGGRVVAEPADLPGTGRKAVVADAQDALVALWEARPRIGAERVNDVGCLCMNELVTPDVERAAGYYGALFGWTTDTSGVAAGGPTMILNDGRVNAAAFSAPDGTRAHWRPCFTVDDTSAAVERIRELGGRVTLGPLTFPDGHGSIAIAVDPQGAPFSIFAGQIDP